MLTLTLFGLASTITSSAAKGRPKSWALARTLFRIAVRRGMLRQPERCLGLKVVLELVIVDVNGNDFETGKDHRREKGEREDGLKGYPPGLR